MLNLKVTSFDKQISARFLNKLEKLGYKPAGAQVIKKKSTILRSPHIFKKARDQIAVHHVSHFLDGSQKEGALNFKLYSARTAALKVDYKYSYHQTVVLLTPTKNKA